MKKFKIEVSHASAGQLQTITAELKIMSNSWSQFGPRILINGEKLRAPRLKLTADEVTSRKLQASRNGLS
jgi:hypothetical protein